MILAFAIGDTCDALGTGPFVARAAQAALNPGVIPAVLFLVSSFIAFSTGTSWGTFAIMIPIAVPMISLIGLHPGMAIASVLGGGFSVTTAHRYRIPPSSLPWPRPRTISIT